MGGWTVDAIGDLRGKVAVVTGANAGIGARVVTELARAGARVVLACRDEDRGAEACRRLEAEVPIARAEVVRLDLADLTSVRVAAEELHDHLGVIDLLVNNAAVMALPQRRTSAQGFELHLATNHLGHFALTGLLYDLLTVRPGARVVTVTSLVERMGRIDVDDLQSQDHYTPYGAYGRSKLANLLFAFELQRRAEAAGASLLSVAAHPGIAATNLWRAGPGSAPGFVAGVRRVGGLALASLVAQDPDGGARPVLYAATSGDVVGGGFYGPGGPGGLRGAPARVTPSARAQDPALAAVLWGLSEELTGVAVLE